MTAASDVLFEWNKLNEKSAAAKVLPCCGSSRWAYELARARPITNAAELLERSDAIWQSLSWEDWDEAFSSHPKIGELKAEAATTQQSIDWSRREQHGIAASGQELRVLLANGNHLYEQRFGRIFIVCATGKSIEDILADLERRLKNDAEGELLEAVEQQRQITRLRLRKWLDR
jgi:2-oxo-4-hydroxy-4-carboxy-5-ureidoimidazoline decarboxylase